MMTTTTTWQLVIMTTITLYCADSRPDNSTSSYQYYHGQQQQQQQQHNQQLLHHRHHHHHHQQQQLEHHQSPRALLSVTTNAKGESDKREGRERDRGGGERDRGGGGGGGGGGGVCDDIRSVQATVIRILNDHYDYDRGIEAFQSELDALKTEVSLLRRQLEKREDNDERRSGRHPHSTDGTSESNILSPLQTYHHHQHHPSISPPPSNSSCPSNSFSVCLDNLTSVVDLHGHVIRQLERRLKWLTKQFKQLQTPVVAHPGASSGGRSGRSIPQQRGSREEEEEEGERREREKQLMLRCEREMAMARDLTTKQRDINANVQRKMKHLEKILTDNIQSDDSNRGHSPSSNRPRMHHGSCPDGFIRHLSSCYLFENSTSSWIDAEKRCQALNPNAHLVSIDTEDEEQFLLQYRSYNAVRWSSRYLWIGANDMTVEGRWSWVASGSEVIYSNWRTGEPSNFQGEQHCAYLHAPETIAGRPGATGGNNVARAGGGGGGGGGGSDGRWDDWSCHSTRINFVCEIVL